MATQFVAPEVGDGDSRSPDGMECRAIREQMERMLTSPHFCNSKRYPVFLRYVIEETLAGRANELKERTVGVEVFQRTPNYDTNIDPIVRVTAGEVRKRIAQYYHDCASHDELRVDLPPGSYIPQFKSATYPFARFSTLVDASYRSNANPILVPLKVESPAADSPPVANYRRRILWIAAAAGLTVSSIFAATVLHRKQNSVESMWKPLLSANTSILVSVGQHTSRPTPDTASNAKPISIGDHAHVSFVVFSDVQALTRITTMLAGFKQPIVIQSSASTTYADHRQRPAILMGGFNNPWTRRALLPLRFHFVRDDVTHLNSIRDERFPNAREWSVDFSQAYTALNHDYAIVARFTDPTTQQVVFVIAGIGEDGTKAASEFVTDPESMRLISTGAPANWSGNNFEAVIGTEVINGVSGPPHVLAKEIW